MGKRALITQVKHITNRCDPSLTASSHTSPPLDLTGSGCIHTRAEQHPDPGVLPPGCIGALCLQERKPKGHACGVMAGSLSTKPKTINHKPYTPGKGSSWTRSGGAGRRRNPCCNSPPRSRRAAGAPA